MNGIKAYTIYHFFPHYRAGIIKELAKNKNIAFVGSTQGVSGIKAYQFEEELFYKAPCIYIGNIMIQPKAILFSFKNSESFIFLANPNHLSTWISAAICRVRGKRVIFWGHGFFSTEKSIKNRIRMTFFSLANAFYTYGFRAKENAVKLGFRPESIYVGFNSLDYEKQIPYRKNLPPPIVNENFRIACVSRLTALCRYDLLLDACAIARERYGLNVLVDFVGEGPEKESLELQAKNLGIQAIFHGAIYEESILSKRFASADVTVMPGKIGLTAMHSMMYGTPVISHDDFERQMPEVEAIVPGYTGNLFRYGDAHDLAAVLMKSREQFNDKVRMRENCFRIIDNIYNPHRQATVMWQAIKGTPAEKGDDAWLLFDEAAE